MRGYAGKFLRVDLTKDRLENQIFDEAILRKYLGGTCLGSKILFEEVKPETKWSDPENRVIIASGPLGGTAVGGSGTISLVTKGALTNGATSVQANGMFGAFMRFSGYDGVIFQGAAENWKYLILKEGSANLVNSQHLLGLDTYQTMAALRNEYEIKGREASVLSIGPAGENLVRFAGTFIDQGHSASHNGSGAVLGSKKLKAIIVFRKGELEIAEPEKLKDVANRIYKNVEYFKGTMGELEVNYKSGSSSVPIRNYTTNIWNISADKLDKFNDEAIRKKYQVRRNPCWGCRLLHATMMEIKDGPYAGLFEEPEYEQLASMGPLIGNNDLEAAIMLSCLTDKLGLETNETGWLISWLMECNEKGLLAKDFASGLDLRWGDIDTIKQLLYMIAYRKGVGDILANGVKQASENLGGLASDLAIYTMKGNTPRTHDHRSRWAEMFDTCVSNTGTIETHMNVMSPDIQGAGKPMKVAKEVAETKGLMEFEDSVGTCRFNTCLNVTLTSEAISAATGWNFTEEEGKNVGKRAVNLMRVFNIKSGIGTELDRPSKRYGSTPLDGPNAGISIRQYWDEMLTEYYSLMGWDPVTGIPTQKTLLALDLDYVANTV